MSYGLKKEALLVDICYLNLQLPVYHYFFMFDVSLLKKSHHVRSFLWGNATLELGFDSLLLDYMIKMYFKHDLKVPSLAVYKKVW